MRRVGFWAALLFLTISPLDAQVPADTANGWNGDGALSLMQRARVRRQQPRGDSALRNYSAKATGFVYFYLDRQETEDKTPVKVDQVALELFWAAPNLTKQRIVGLRDRSLLPNKMYYHLDHLTVVQNGFGDVIRLGDGDEVRDVPHPAAPRSDTVYDFRLADSTTLNFPPQPPVRVYEVQVRPKFRDRSALIGSIFIDQASADIVRMTFTFTPASYVDRRLDYINISLDNGLWSGAYWLPNEQYVEIHRQIPELDFVAGAVIKGRLRVYDYKFNLPLARDFFFGAPVEAAAKEERQNFPFEESILAGLEREDLASLPQIDVLRAEAIKLMRGRKLTGLPAVRLYIPNSSSVLRYNRSEGLYLGGGVTYEPKTVPLRFDLLGGYAFAPRLPSGSLSVRTPEIAGWQASARAYYREIRDLGTFAPLPLGLNTISSLFGHDYYDLYHARGLQLHAQHDAGAKTSITLQAGFEHQDAFGGVDQSPIGDRAFRPAPTAVTTGDVINARITMARPVWSSERIAINGRASLEAAHFTDEPAYRCPAIGPCPKDDPGSFVRPELNLHATFVSASRGWTANADLSLGALIGEPARQSLYYLGGLGTLPANPHRLMIGKRFQLAQLDVSRLIAAPWARLHLTGAAGFVGGTRLTWPLPDSAYTSAASVGIGASLLWDVLRFDLVYGTRSKDARLLFTVRKDLWHMM